jgi:hypothetical protein
MRSRIVGLAWPIRYGFDSLSTQPTGKPLSLCRSHYAREALLTRVEIMDTGGEHRERYTNRNHYQFEIDGLIRQQTSAETIHHSPAWIQSQY